MNSLKTITLLCVVCLALGLAPNSAVGTEEYEYIDISNPFLRKIPTAIPRFKNTAGNTILLPTVYPKHR